MNVINEIPSKKLKNANFHYKDICAQGTIKWFHISKDVYKHFTRIIYGKHDKLKHSEDQEHRN